MARFPLSLRADEADGQGAMSAPARQNPDRRPFAAAAMATFVLLGASSCVTEGGISSERASKQEQRARTIFEDLISRGQRPQDSGGDVFDVDSDDSFDRAAREYADPEPSEAAEEAAALEEVDSAPINPYLEFGPNIVWYPLRDGDDERLIMKPYTFPAGSGQKIFDLLKMYGDFELHAAVIDGALDAETGQQPDSSVLLDLRPGFSVEAYSNPREAGLRTPEAIALSDVLFVTANTNEMLEVEHFIDLFSADVRQIEVEAKIVEVTTREALDLGVRPIDGATPIFGLPNSGTFVNNVDFSFGNSVEVTEALFQLGAVFDGVTFNAILEAVASFENVSIISRPKVAVREGGRADIVNVTSIPFYRVAGISASGIPTTTLEFKDVGVQMFVIPRIVGRDTVVLNIEIEASQSTGTAVSFVVGESVISVPEISQRNARTIVRLEPGQAVILGGLISERTVNRESKVPIVGDIPLLGTLFRSKIKSKEQTNVLFFIRPRILEGGDLNSPFE